MTGTDVAPATRAATDDSRPLIVTSPPHSRSLLGTAVQVVSLLLLLSILAAVVMVLFAVGSLANVTGGVGSQLNGVASQASRAVGQAQQALQNATDPNHPPPGLIYDTELTALDVWRVGEGLPGGTEYVLTVQSIQRRAAAESADTAQYALIHAQLRQPHETRIFGQLVHSDSDPHDYAVYKGEAFRIGQAVYRANWISQQQSELGVGVLRNPDALTQPLKFEYE